MLYDKYYYYDQHIKIFKRKYEINSDNLLRSENIYESVCMTFVSLIILCIMYVVGMIMNIEYMG